MPGSKAVYLAPSGLWPRPANPLTKGPRLRFWSLCNSGTSSVMARQCDFGVPHVLPVASRDPSCVKVD
nr:hypothetical protein CFP56_30962 [Quercus suber]